MALTWTRRILTGRSPARSTTTDLPAGAPVSEAQLVASVSSMSLSWLTPSPGAGAPEAAGAWLRGGGWGGGRGGPGSTPTLSREWSQPAPVTWRAYAPG